MGIAAIILGILGLKAANRNPAAKGKVHAIVGLVLGSIFTLVWLGVLVLWIVLIMRAPMRVR